MDSSTSGSPMGSRDVALSPDSGVVFVPDERVDEMFQEYERAFAAELEEYTWDAQVQKAARRVDALIVSVAWQKSKLDLFTNLHHKIFLLIRYTGTIKCGQQKNRRAECSAGVSKR